MKGKRTKKITLSISVLAVVTAIITVVALLVNTQNKKAKLLRHIHHRRRGNG